MLNEFWLLFKGEILHEEIAIVSWMNILQAQNWFLRESLFLK